MTKIASILFLFCFLCTKAEAQININPGVDTTDVDIKSAVKFYIAYMGDFKGKKLPDFSKYWSEVDCKKYKIPDPAVYGIGGDYPTYSMAETRTISYVKPLKNGQIVLKSIGGWVDSLKKIELLYITHSIIEKDNNQQLRFVLPIKFDEQNWQKHQLKNISYVFPKSHRFNPKKADSLIFQIEQLEKQWDLKPIKIEYFFADTYDEIQKIRGYDFSLGLGNRDKPSGISNQTDNIVYSAGNGENYFHEIVHIYLNPIHPKSPLNEGLAVFYGGSMGKDLAWHVQRVKTYLKNHPEINLNNLSDFYFMDNNTNPASTIQGLICDVIYKKEGINGIKRLMTYTNLNDVFEKEFKFDVKNLNKELRALINQQ